MTDLPIIRKAHPCRWAFFIEPDVLVETTVMANVAAVMAEVHSIMAKIHPVISNFHPIVTDVTIITMTALGLGSNAYNQGSGEEDG
jgi:hypothetical protein